MTHLLYFLMLLALGVAGLWGLMRWDRRKVIEYRAAALMCFFGLHSAGLVLRDFLPPHPTAPHQTASAAIAPDPIAPNPTAPAATASDPPLPDGFSFDPRWGPERRAEYLERFKEVYEIAGPPPQPDSVPRRGYVDRNGVFYPPRWQAPPDARRGNNYGEFVGQ